MSFNENKEFWIKEEKIREHTLLFGTTASGLTNPNIATDKIKEENFKNRKIKMEEEQKLLVKKHSIFKRNYLSNFNTMEELYDEFHHIFDCAERFYNKDIKTLEDFKVLYFNIPQHIFGQAVSYGFDDSVVRDDLNEFFEKNEFKLLEEKYIQILKLIQ